jgi:hypothetical protein
MSLTALKRQINTLLETPVETLLAADADTTKEEAAEWVAGMLKHRQDFERPMASGILTVRDVLDETEREMEDNRMLSKAHEQALDSGMLQEAQRNDSGETIDTGAEHIYNQTHSNAAKNYDLFMKALGKVTSEAPPSHVEFDAIRKTLANTPAIVNEAIEALEELAEFPSAGKCTPREFLSNLDTSAHYTNLQLMLVAISEQFRSIAKDIGGISFP